MHKEHIIAGRGCKCTRFANCHFNHCRCCSISSRPEISRQVKQLSHPKSQPSKPTFAGVLFMFLVYASCLLKHEAQACLDAKEGVSSGKPASPTPLITLCATKIYRPSKLSETYGL